MNDFRYSKDAMELFYGLRSSYRFVCPESAVALEGFLSGFCLALNLSMDSLRETIQRSVEDFFPLSKGGTWFEIVSKEAAVFRSEIPLVYAASDYARGILYENAFSCCPSVDSKAGFSVGQKRVSGAQGLPAPEKLVLVESMSGCWHLFFLNESGDRYFEVSMSAEEKLKGWVRGVFQVSLSDWIRECPGTFAVGSRLATR